MNDRPNESRKVLEKIRDATNVDAEFKELKKASAESAQHGPSQSLDLSVKSVRRALLVGCLLQVSLVLCSFQLPYVNPLC